MRVKHMEFRPIFALKKSSIYICHIRLKRKLFKYVNSGITHQNTLSNKQCETKNVWRIH